MLTPFKKKHISLSLPENLIFYFPKVIFKYYSNEWGSFENNNLDEGNHYSFFP